MSKNYKKWNEAELNFIRNNSNSMKDSEIAQKLGEVSGDSSITVAMVRRQRRKLNMAKTRGRRTNKVVVASSGHSGS